MRSRAAGSWGFTTIFNNTAQGNFLATYIPHILGEQTISIVYSDEPYGQSLHDALTASLGPDVTVANTWRIDMSADGRAKVAGGGGRGYRHGA